MQSSPVDTHPVSDGKAEQCDREVMSIFSGQPGSCERGQ